MHYYDKEPAFKEMRVKRIRTTIRGIPLTFVVGPGVFSNEYVDAGTRLLAENMVIMDYWDILDMGCGYGVLGIVAAKLAPNGRVVMVDINRLAVKLASVNVKLNTIITNPPITAGLEVNRKLILGAKEHLKPGGLLQIVIPKKLRSRFEEMLMNNYDVVERLAKSGGYIVYAAKVMK